MDRAYEGDETRSLAVALGYIPVVPPKQNRKEPWEYDKEIYKRRNEVERFFLRIKRFRRVFTRYDKLDIMFAGFILFAMIVDSIVWTSSNKDSLLRIASAMLVEIDEKWQTENKAYIGVSKSWTRTGEFTENSALSQ